MYNFAPFLKYRVNGKSVESTETENSDYKLDLEIDDNAIKCILSPKSAMEMLEFKLVADKPTEKKEVFFANGYQSWTTSREYKSTDTVKGMIKLANISKFTKGLAGVSGDYHFKKYDVQGLFHSYTYTYFRLDEKLEFFGSLSERVGYTIFNMDFNSGKFTVEKDIEGVTLDSECEIFNILCARGEYDEVFDKYFGSMNLREPKIQHLSGYTSWYNYFQKIDEKIILRDLNGLDRAKDEVSIFQIDDGYESFVGDWLVPDSKKFPRGMKVIADEIHKKGYLAGIWIAPFSAQRNSVIAKEHPDWLIRDNENGKPLLGSPGWGGAYTLDFYNEEARAYIKNFFNVILREWEYDMVKLDFLYSEAMQPRRGKTRGQIMCEAMDFLRECVGEDKLILGCGVPLGPSFGVVDACRISCDVDLKYGKKFYNVLGINLEIPSAQNAINNSIFRRHLNGRAFCSDPDVFFLRNNNLRFTLPQKLLLAKINNLCGDVLFVSDNAGDYTEKEIEYLKTFFRKNESKILMAEYTSDDSLLVRYEENGKVKNLRFIMSTGRSNIENLLK